MKIMYKMKLNIPEIRHLVKATLARMIKANARGIKK